MQPVAGGVDESKAARRTRPGRIALIVGGITGAVLLLMFLGLLPPVSGMVAFAVVLTTVFWLIRTHLPSILLVFVAVLLVSVLITQPLPKIRADRIDAQETERLSRDWKGSGKFNENLPIVVHLVFDELASAGAMTEDLPGGTKTREALLEFGEKYSFRTFDSVYSRYYYTSESLDHLMNREYSGRTGMDSFSLLPFNDKTKSYAVPSNAYFDDMARRGYRTVVFRPTYMNYCANANVDLCETFDSFDPGRTAGVDAPTQRVILWQMIFRAYAPSYTSQLGSSLLGRFYGLRPDGNVGVVGQDGRYDVHRFPQWFDRFTSFVASAPRGTHVFAHFLVPHSPYLLLENCVLSGKIEATSNLVQYPAGEREKKRRDGFDRYFAQVRCVESGLDKFMSAIGRSENFRDAVIVIHGDHGSRISNSDVLEDYTERDFVDNYGTYFAIRSPQVDPGVDCEFVSLPEVFRRYIARGVDNRPRAGNPLPVVVLSRSAGGAKVEAPMPRFGCGAAVASQ